MTRESKGKSVEELLQESRALRLSFKKEKSAEPPVTFTVPLKALPWKYWYCQVLTNADFSWEDILINVYSTDGPVGISSAPVGSTVLIHNHSRDKRCLSMHHCYVLGYKETEVPEGGTNAD